MKQLQVQVLNTNTDKENRTSILKGIEQSEFVAIQNSWKSGIQSPLNTKKPSIVISIQMGPKNSVPTSSTTCGCGTLRNNSALHE